MAGAFHSLPLCSDGTVAAWGWGDFGQLGNNTGGVFGVHSLVPVAVNTASGVSALYGKTVVAIAAGATHSLALCSNGMVAAWGSNMSGMLGDNSPDSSLVPVAVNTASNISALYGKAVVAIGAGAYHSLALCSDGTVAAWGDDNYGQLGDNGVSGYAGQVPVAVSTNSGVSALYGKTVVAIATGWGHCLAQCSDGTVAAWDLNGFGQLGDNTSGTNRLVPVAVITTPLTATTRLARTFSGTLAEHTLAMVAAPPATGIIMTNAQTLSDGAFQFAFTNTPGAFFSVVASTNPALPLNTWTPLSGMTEVSPGQFQFTDPQATNSPQRFYRVRSP